MIQSKSKKEEVMVEYDVIEINLEKGNCYEIVYRYHPRSCQRLKHISFDDLISMHQLIGEVLKERSSPYKITLQDLYEETNGGLDIILFFYPQASECLSGEQKQFRIRESALKPSAVIRKYRGVWRVRDFGNTGTAMSPIEICMKECNLPIDTALDFLEYVFFT